MKSNLYEIIERSKIVDERGFFLKTMTGNESNLSNQFGEIYVIKGEGGSGRANHYHLKATEWFTILLGQVWLNLKHIETGEYESILLDDFAPLTVRINPGVAHSLIGVDHRDYILMAYTDLRYDPADTIAHPFIEVKAAIAGGTQS